MKRFFIGLLILLVLLVCVVFFLVSSESGLSFMVSQLNRWQPAGLSIQSASGKVLGPLSIQGFKREADDGVVTVESFDLDWESPAPWRRVLLIESAKIDGIRVNLTPQDVEAEPEASTEPFALPDSLALPIDILVNQVLITDVKIKTNKDADELVFDSIELSVNATREDDANINLAVASDWLKLNAKVDAVTRERYKLNGGADWSLTLPDLAPINGDLSLTGDLDQLTMTPSVDAPYGVDLKAIVNNPLESLLLDLSGTISSTDLSSIKADLPPYGIDADIAFNGTPEQADSSSLITITGLTSDAVTVELKSQIEQKLLLIDALQVRVDNQSLSFAANGTVDLSGVQPVVDIESQWADVQWPLEGEPLMTSKTGSIKAKGPIDQIAASITAQLGEQGQLDTDARLSGDNILLDVSWSEIAWPLDGSQVSSANGALLLNGTLDNFGLSLNTTSDVATAGRIVFNATGVGSDKHVSLPMIQGSALSGNFTGRAKANLAPALSFSLDVDGSGFDPVALSAELPGDLSLGLSVSGETVNEELNVTLKTLDVNGVLRNLPLEVKAIANTEGSRIEIETISANSGQSKLLLDGIIDDKIAVNWTLDSPDISTLYGSATGRIKSSGSVNGALPLPAIEGTIDAANLSFDGMSVRSIKALANIDPSEQGDIELDIKVDSVVAPGIELSSFTTKANGQVDNHNINLAVRSNQGNIDLGIDGQLKQPLWNYTIKKLNLDPPDLDTWTLVKPASGLVNGDAIELSQLCLQSGDARLCSDVKRNKDTLLASYKLNNFPLAYVRSFIPEGTFIDGSVSSEGNWNAPTGKAPTGQLDTTLNDIKVHVFNPDEEKVTVLNMQPSSFNAKLDATGVNARTTLNLGRQGALNGNLSAQGSLDTLAKGNISGALTGEIKDFDFLVALVPDIEAISGRLKSDVRVSGTASKPVISGGVTFDQGALKLLTPGLDLKNIQATIKAKSGTVLDLRADASSGDGQLNVNGTIDLADEKPEFSVAINGRDFEVLNTLDAKAAISPKLDLLVRQDRVYFNGDVDIPRLEITPKKIPTGVVLANSDQVIVTEEPTEAKGSPVPVKGTLNVTLGENVRLDAFGLKAQLSGKLRVNETPGSETTATGKLVIDEGEFKAYGQDLKVQNGQIIFAGGPISQPGFDIEAVRVVTSELQVGVRARGAIKNPRFNLFSTPAMTESEQMSYLVLGRSLDDNSPAENSAVRQAAMALGVAGGKLLTEKFGNKLGLDSVAIDSEMRETGEQAALTVGKYLSPKLFVSYGVGLFEPVSTLRLNYTLSRNVKIISETTESRSGGDIVFTFESDQ